MYLSRVKIDMNNRRKIRDLTDVAAYHNWVEKSFPDEFKSQIRTRKLWRIDELKGERYLLIVSEKQPDLQLLETYGVPGSAETKEYDEYLQNLKSGMKCRFRAVLNPVVSVPQQEEQRGRVMPEVTVKYQMKYLLDRAEKNGFSLREEQVEIVERGFVHWHKGKTEVRLCRVAYEGILTIKDEDLFRQTLIKGIGKKKAYGFGMITVIPLKE